MKSIWTWHERSLTVTLALALGVLAIVGCGGGPATEKVTGTITANGQPVTGGTISFAPVAEGAVATVEPMSATVGSDGTFSLGVVAGKNRVMYYAPPVEQGEAQEWDGKGKPPETNKSPYDGLRAEPSEVEIKSGKNELTFELVPARAR